MPETLRPRVLVVGGGPGGYVAAIRAGQLGLDTVLVDAERLGGTCLLRGCIPSKALIHAADRFADIAAANGGNALGISVADAPLLDLAKTIAWKDAIVDRLTSGVSGLLARANVRVVEGWARFTDARHCVIDTATGPVDCIAENIVLATGSEPVALPSLPFGGNIISSTEALSPQRLPERLVVIGAGYIGLELGIAYRKFGVAVSIVEAAERILPRYDTALTAPVRRWLTSAGIDLHLGAKVIGLDGSTNLAIETASGPLTLPADQVLVTVGRRPLVEGWGLENMALDRNGRFVAVDDQCRTAMRHIWAIGDLVGEPMLAHKAMAQGAMVAEIIAGQRRHFDPASVAAIVFTEPEIIVAGMLPDDAAAAGIDAATAVFPLSANGRALTLEAGETGGFVRIVSRRDDGVALGIQAVGRHVAELAGEFSHALAMGAVLDDIAHTIHVHPTLGEAVGEAALLGLGGALHL
ncbi:MAG TPA: dihydrolipoyl dehydrogenase [Stellaceae bacterium]|jgi:dihydrolipoamide dehydrogenase|nr:dihydrolipoyl dehydrogenase [Stellaceae bacterium]